MIALTVILSVIIISLIILRIPKTIRDSIDRAATERKHDEQGLERLNTDLMNKNRELEQIIYVTSHDLRSPLVNIQGFSSELERSFKDIKAILQHEDISSEIKERLAPILNEDVPESLRYISSSTNKIYSLLSGLLQLSRLEQKTVAFKQLEMNKLIRDVVENFEFRIKEAEVRMLIDELPPCKGDEVQINLVFANLLGNALKYLDPNRKGNISISGRREGVLSIYCVEDNGIGIPVEHRGIIFDLFHRLNPHDSPGEGLGLAIARKIISKHSGEIWVESESDKGSKFFVSLPNL